MPHRWSHRQVVQGAGAVGLGLLAGCGRWPGQAPAPERVPRIGYLDVLGADDPYAAQLWEGLRDLGYHKGQNLVVESRFADGKPEQLPLLAAELAGLNLELIAASGVTAAKAASEAAPRTPVVIVRGGGDAVGTGLIASFARPGANVTGVVTASTDLIGKWLELLGEVLPRISRVAVLSDPTNETTDAHLNALARAAAHQQVRLQYLDVDEPQVLASAFAAMDQEHAEALILVPGSRATRQRSRIAALALAHGLPAVAEWRDFTADGGLMNYGASSADLVRQAATFVDKILKGAKPADLPVERPMRFDFVINLRTAQALGLTIPPHVLLQATEVIQ
jgi:putative tryptophan/tyrosine transport system substrate-binding protein